jgi:hypothetical protein
VDLCRQRLFFRTSLWNEVRATSTSFSAIDPCAGDGTALLEITKNTGAQLAGIELDADRAAACAAKGIATVCGSAFECRVPAESCSLLYLNPPYDTESGPHSNERMELVFPEHCYRWTVSEGVLVLVIPSTALGRCARLLASQFVDCGSSAWSMPNPYGSSR